MGQLYVQSPSFNYHSSHYLSIDREPYSSGGDGNEDDMEFTLTVPAFAFGVLNVVDNVPGSQLESITVYGTSGVIYTQSSIPDFFGILADEPIIRVFFDEKDFDGDDIGYDNIVVGNVVPIPTTLLLLSTGLAGLVAFRRRLRR